MIDTLMLHMKFQSSYNHTIILYIGATDIVILCCFACSLFGDNCFHLLCPGGTVQATLSTKYINMIYLYAVQWRVSVVMVC